MSDAAEILKYLDGLAFIRELYPELQLTPDQSSETRVFCPFHDDRPNPSGSFNVNTKMFRCFSCNAGGTAIELMAQRTGQARYVVVEFLARRLGVPAKSSISPKLVEEWHAALRVNAPLLEELAKRRGLDVQTVERWRLGWLAKEQRLAIPVRDESGAVVNVRQYDLLKVHPPEKKFLNVKGHGQLRLFPLEALQQETVVLTEGELKMIGLVQRGFNAITATGGAAGWKDEWDRLFEGKVVYICYDVDATGQARARSLARRLIRYAKELRVLTLPLDLTTHPHGDVLDYFVKDGYSPNDFQNLILGTSPWNPEAEAPGLRDDITYEVGLPAASKAQYYLHKIETSVIVSAKDTAPYIAPKAMRVNCSRDLEICPGCPVYTQPEEAEYVVDADDPDVLKLIDVSARSQDKELRELIGIPSRCTASDLVVTETHNLEEVRLVPQLDTTGQGNEQVVVKAYYVGHGIETNSTYKLKARSATSPKTQHATLLAYEATPNVDSLTSFDPGLEEMTELKLFQPREWTVDGLDEKLGELYEDLENNVTRIYQRRALHVLMDLVWHSALYVTLDRDPMKGWVDALVIGDSGQGKSETSARLMKHYGLGEKIDMKGASVAGLKGGLQDTQGRWFVTWGVVPLNDRRLAVLEEVKGCPTEVLQALTDMRSSGVAELTKIERRRAWARTRLLWISNPRSDRKIETYNFGVLAVKELMGSLEDVRRFDVALVVASNEVDASVISKALTSDATRHSHTSELCRRLILWAWSRSPAQVVIEPAAKEACLARALEQSRKYSSSIPLVEPADHRLKIARLSAALAARTFSCSEDMKTLLVKPAHVDWVTRYLDSVYSSRFMGYDSYSGIKAMDAELTNPEQIKQALEDAGEPDGLVRNLMRATEIRASDFTDWVHRPDQPEQVRELARSLLSLLVRNNALQRRSSSYYKTGAFIEFLKQVKFNGVPDHVREAHEY